MMLIYDKVSYVAPYQRPWQSLKRWHESDRPLLLNIVQNRHVTIN